MSVHPNKMPKRTRESYSHPALPAVYGFLALGVFFSILAAWSSWAPISGAAIARGNLQVEGKRQVVQHPYGGVVKQIFVQEGANVTKGQVLITLFDANPRAKLDVLLAEKRAIKAKEVRLIAERDGKTAEQFTQENASSDAEQAIRNEAAIMAARTKLFESELEVIKQKAAQLKEQIIGNQTQYEGLSKQRDLIEEEAKGARELLEKGLTPKTRVLALEREIARLEAEKGAKLSEIARAKEGISQIDSELAKAERARLTEIADQLRAAQASLAEMGPKESAANDVVERTSITAPATGTVVGLAVFTEGGVIQQGAKLLEVVPTSNPLFVEARLPMTQVTDIVPGLRADVRLTSINHAERPNLSGQVLTVSADRLTDDKTGQGFYAVQVKLDENDVKKSRITLLPGMVADVVISTKPRTLVEYLVSPLIDEITGAFREK